MVVSNSNNIRDLLTADGTKTEFDFTSKITDESELLVYVLDLTNNATLQAITIDYTIVINTVNQGGTVTFLTAPANNYQVLMFPNLPYGQSANIPINGGFKESVIEGALDRLAIQIQQVRDALSKAPQLVDTSLFDNLMIPDPKALNLLQWKSDLTGLQNIQLSDISEVTADITILPGDAHKLVKLNSAETDYELEAFATGFSRPTALTTGGTLTIVGAASCSTTLGVTGVLTANALFKASKGANVASASSITLGDDGNTFDITGTTNIQTITAKSAGTIVILKFNGTLNLIDNTGNLELRGSNINVIAEDVVTLVSDGTNWHLVSSTSIHVPSAVQGDILYFNGSRWVRLAKGTALQVLRMNSGATAPEWGTNPSNDAESFSVTTSGNIDINSGTTSKITTFDTEDFDVGSNFASDAFTAPSAGKYLITFGMTITLITTTNAHTAKLFLYKEGVEHELLILVNDSVLDTINKTCTVSGAIIVDLALDDEVDLRGEAVGTGGSIRFNDGYFQGFKL